MMMDKINRDFGGRFVLVVDDDVRLRSYIRILLGSANAQVLEAGDGLEALQLFRVWRDKLALVITDIRMPRMSGKDFALLIRLQSEIPLIFVSGEPAPVNANDSENGFLFIEKPFGAKVLLDAVSSCLQLVPAIG